MSFLADENFPRFALEALRRMGFQVAAIPEDSPGMGDEEVLSRCGDEKLTLLTLDKDFGELVFRLNWPGECGIILFRVDTQSPEEFVNFALAVLHTHEDWAGKFVVVSRDRIRLRRISKL